MVRLSDFIFDTAHPPKVIEKPFTKQLAKLMIPGKNGAVLQDMGSNNMKISLQGSLYNIVSDTDKRRTDMESLMTLAMANNPMPFTHDSDHPCGANGDNWSEYANTTLMDVDWTFANVTRSVEGSTKKFGSYSMKLVLAANSLISIDNISSINCNHPEYSALCFWIHASSVGANDDIEIYLCTGGNTSNSFKQTIDVSEDLTAATWTEVVMPVGQGAENNFTETGTGDWTDIDTIYLDWGASASGTVYIDGFCLTHAVLFEGIPQYTNPPGRPDQYNYSMSLVQYIQ